MADPNPIQEIITAIKMELIPQLEAAAALVDPAESYEAAKDALKEAEDKLKENEPSPTDPDPDPE